jgi:hypothetical protein
MSHEAQWVTKDQSIGNIKNKIVKTYYMKLKKKKHHKHDMI